MPSKSWAGHWMWSDVCVGVPPEALAGSSLGRQGRLEWSPAPGTAVPMEEGPPVARCRWCWRPLAKSCP